MVRQRISMTALALVAASLVGTAAYAHPTLTSSNPQANASTSNYPTEIRLNFSEGVVAKLSGIDLKDESGKAIATGAAATDPKDSKQLIVPLTSPLAAGRYTVSWHVVSEDTHRVKGEYSFKVEH